MIIKNVLETIKTYEMFDENDTAFVGFSGGADSTALLLALKELSDELKITVKAIHVNHMLRGKESDRDENFCRNLCEKENIPFISISVNVREYSEKNGKSIEESARILRYEAFYKNASNGKICTAHNLNDNAETIIFNMTRGTGLKGLCGIPFKRDNIVRPILTSTREDVENYLKKKNQDFVTDSTNITDDYTRNNIRHNVIPILEQINNGFLNNIKKMIQIFENEDEYLNELAQININNDLRDLHPAMRRRVIINILKNHDIEVSNELVKRLELATLENKNVKVNVKKNCYALINDGKISIDIDQKRDKVIFEPILARIGENAFLGDKKVMIFVNNGEIIKDFSNINKKLTNEHLDYDTIQGDILLRNRRDGDGYIRCSREFRSSLKKLFNENVLPNLRDYICILEDDEGIIWVEGFGIADRVKVTENTKNVMYIEITNGNS